MKKRIEGYQVMINGRETLVSDLNLTQARVEICEAIDILEEMDSKVADLTELLRCWRWGIALD